MRFDGPAPGWDQFLDGLNVAALAEFPRPSGASGGTDVQIFGLPRSGTTVLYQLLAATRELGYPSNVMAMYHRAPWVGARIQAELARQLPSLSVESLAGRTREPLDPHEFGFFWRRVLGHRTNSLVDRAAPPDWTALAQELDAVHDVFGRPVVYKNFLVLAHLAQMRRHLPRMRFLALDRPVEEVAVSLLALRRGIGVSDDRAFGTTVEGNAEAPADVHQRVARQVVGLQAALTDLVTGTARTSGGGTVSSDVMVVSYDRLCRQPREVVAGVLDFLEVEHGPHLDALPARLAPTRAPVLSSEDRTRLDLALRAELKSREREEAP